MKALVMGNGRFLNLPRFGPCTVALCWLVRCSAAEATASASCCSVSPLGAAPDEEGPLMPGPTARTRILLLSRSKYYTSISHNFNALCCVAYRFVLGD